MSENVETMAYANEVPWHGLGHKVTNALTPEEMCAAAQIDWTVSKRPAFYKNAAGEFLPTPNEFALVRDSDDKFLSAVGSSWKPNQNIDAISVFKKFVTAGKMKMETAGSLVDGKYVWALAKLGIDYTVGKDDEVTGYLLMSNPHVLGKSILYKTTAVRVVCWNTFSLALGANLKGNGAAFRVPHSQKFNVEAAEVAVALATNTMEELKLASNLLAKKKAKPDRVEQYWGELLQYDPKKAKKKTVKGEPTDENKEPDMLKQFRLALESGPGADLGTARGTWWGAFNSVTRVLDFEIGNKRDTALKAAWFGGKAALKVEAFQKALEYAK